MTLETARFIQDLLDQLKSPNIPKEYRDEVRINIIAFIDGYTKRILDRQEPQ